jgi:hypothetical protein
MRIWMTGLGILAAVGPVGAQGKVDFEFRRELATGRRLYVQNVIGNVRVTGGSGRQVEVSAVKQEGRYGDPEDVTVDVVELPDGVALCVRYPGQRSRERDDRSDVRDSRTTKPRNPCSSDGWSNSGNRNDTRVNFTVLVPDGLVLRIGTVSGDVVAERLSGTLELESVSGDVSLSGGTGPSIALETVSGDIDLLDGHAKDVSGHTVSGHVTFAGPVMDGGSYDFSTTSGDIRLTLPGRPNATLSAATFSGGFSSDLPTNQDTSRRRRHRYDATWGNGSARLDVESLSGDIRIITASR